MKIKSMPTVYRKDKMQTATWGKYLHYICQTKTLLPLIYKEFLQTNKEMSAHTDKTGKAHKQDTQKLKHI